jgi:hypothetical protein
MKSHMKKVLLFFASAVLSATAFAQDIKNNPGSSHANKFEQLGTVLPTPNEYRTASGAPGSKYWQQRCDYNIKATLDEKNLKLTGSETVTYYNSSPDVLTYLWLQLDENQHSNVNNANYPNSNAMPGRVSMQELAGAEVPQQDNGYGHIITKLTDATGKKLNYTINKTMMRVELPQPLKAGQKFVFVCDWYYKIPDRVNVGGRGGYEYFAEDGNHLFTIAQWYPRLCVYSDFQGWQNHQFAGRGEFALTFGNFKVQITVPADHVVGATGVCRNYKQVLTPTQWTRWQKAQTAKDPVEIVTLAEAQAAEKKKANAFKTWIFQADSVRDFAWTSSRKYVWDAMPAEIEGKKSTTMCMSFYPKEAYTLWSRYSTKAVAHTLKTYSHYTLPYPYPVAQSVEAANGMEYPMICFNNGRTNKDGSYSEQVKYAMLGVIIHEVGHNYFPMIVNSDERQWTWMDEGLNSFLQYLAQESFDEKFPSRRGPAWAITDYMKLPKNQLEPIMTNSENIVNFGSNAYGKPATALNILRETVMGRELFDYAFKQYAQRWAFKHPTPADFFRTMEDASGEDLDWFWRGWFYSTDACDISLDSVKIGVTDAKVTNGTPGGSVPGLSQTIFGPQGSRFDDITKTRNREEKTQYATDADTSLRDFYWRYNRGLETVDTSKLAVVTPMQNADEMTDQEKQKFSGKYYYELSLSNKGGLVMPIIVEWTFKDGSKQIDRIPAQVWRMDENNVVKTFFKNKEVASIRLDPFKETADIDESNNTWGNVSQQPTRLEVFKAKQQIRGHSTSPNPMQKATEKKKDF